MSVEKVHEKIYLIDTVALGVEKVVAAYLVVDDKTAVVDVGYASSLNALLSGIMGAGLNPRKLDYIILTHIHPDHGGCAGNLAEVARRAQVYVHPKGAPHLIDPSKLRESVKTIYGEYFEMLGDFTPIPEDRVVEAEDGEELSLGSTELRFIHAPGHAPHHMTIYMNDEQILFSGDSFSMKIPSFPLHIPTTAPPSYRHELMLETIKNLSKLNGKKIMRPHYGPIEWSQKFFDEQINVFNYWRDLILNSIKNFGKDAFKNVLKDFAAKAKMNIEDIPWHVELNLKTFFEGMRIYLEKTGQI